MNLLEQFQAFIVKEDLFSPKDKLLLAVSGGLDSVVLCELCQQAGYDFSIAHCNFQLRQAESERDAEFVTALGKQYNKEVYSRRFDTMGYAAEKKVSIQVAARELRYGWFFELVASRAAGIGGPSTHHPEKERPTTGARRPTHILTAHHLNDNIETLLMNFFKGTGIAGLHGILPKQGAVVRPLLFAKKEELKQFAGLQQLVWVEDSSNQSDKYARNYLRQQIIPLVQQLYPAAENNLANNLERFREMEILYQQSISLHKKKLLEQKGNEIHIPVLKLQKSEPLLSIVYEIIKGYGFGAGQVPDAIALLNSETGKFIQSATHRIIRNRHWLIITPNQAAMAQHVLVEGTGVVEFGMGKLELEWINNSKWPIPNASDTALLDEKYIHFPLLLRRWKTGDYFYPLGMQKKKKLARFLIDRKLSKTEKEKIWVLESGKKILWVIGQRIDDRCKITAQSKNILQVTLKSFDI